MSVSRLYCSSDRVALQQRKVTVSSAMSAALASSRTAFAATMGAAIARAMLPRAQSQAEDASGNSAMGDSVTMALGG